MVSTATARSTGWAATRTLSPGRQRDTMTEAGPIGRIVAIAADPDPLVSRRALEVFEPAIPTTGEGLLVAGMGFLATYGLLRLAVRPFSALRRRPAAVPGKVRG